MGIPEKSIFTHKFPIVSAAGQMESWAVQNLLFVTVATHSSKALFINWLEDRFFKARSAADFLL
jgi:hypothetical protein